MGKQTVTYVRKQKLRQNKKSLRFQYIKSVEVFIVLFENVNGAFSAFTFRDRNRKQPQCSRFSR